MANGTATIVGVSGAAHNGLVAPISDITIIKCTPTSCVVAIRGNKTSTVSLSHTCATIFETPTTPKVDIRAVWFNCLSATGNSIVRNGHTLWALPAWPGSWRTEGWCENIDNTSDIVVNIGTNGGTVVLELSKKGGYGDEQHNPLL